MGEKGVRVSESVVIWKYSREVRMSESESERCLGVRITIEYA